jgi:hypothetical protein
MDNNIQFEDIDFSVTNRSRNKTIKVQRTQLQHVHWILVYIVNFLDIYLRRVQLKNKEVKHVNE